MSLQLQGGGGGEVGNTTSQPPPPQDQVRTSTPSRLPQDQVRTSTPCPQTRSEHLPPPLSPGPGQNIYALPPPLDQVRTSTPSPPDQVRTSTPPPPPGPGQNIYPLPPGSIGRRAVRILLECILVSCSNCTVNLNFHVIRSKTLPTNDFELTVHDL